MLNHNTETTMAFPGEIPSTQDSPKVFSYTVKDTDSISYASAAQKHQFPKRDQGLIIDCAEGLNLTDYTCAVGELVEKGNILYSTRISNNRICLYLASKDLVNELTDKHKFLQIGEIQVNVRPLIIKQQRVIFSNVAPPIPNFVLEDILDNLNIKRGSQITTLKASIAKDGFSHVLSSRRQTYINPEDTSKLPDLLKINYEDVTYYIYPSTSSLKCFLCKMEGHIAKHCQTKSDSSQNNNDPSSKNKTTSPAVINSQSHEVAGAPIDDGHPASNMQFQNANETPKNPAFELMPPPINNKRPPSSNISTLTENSTKLKRETKKPKKSQETVEKRPQDTEIAIILQPASKLIEENASSYSLDLKNIVNFLSESYGSRKIPDLARSYTQHIMLLCGMLQDIYDNITDNNLKSRIRRIIKRLTYDSQLCSDDASSTSESLSIEEEEL